LAIGIYGKLPAKRDFIASGAPRAFLDLWEPWLDSCLAGSRAHLAEAWTDAYMSAPIWRFFLGDGLAGRRTLGAMMPSVDGVGRTYPLALLWTEERQRIADPCANAQTPWYRMVEPILLGALEPDVEHDMWMARAAALSDPGAAAPEAGLRGVAPPSGEAPDRSVWWTVGDGEALPAGRAFSGMPDVAAFCAFLQGRAADADVSP
jgi:type VI secretion system protein ImpM